MLPIEHIGGPRRPVYGEVRFKQYYHERKRSKRPRISQRNGPEENAVKVRCRAVRTVLDMRAE